MIKQIDFEDDWTSRLGVAPASLERLSNLVILAGPNGGGKTRYLQIVQAHHQDAPGYVEGAKVAMLYPVADDLNLIHQVKDLTPAQAGQGITKLASLDPREIYRSLSLMLGDIAKNQVYEASGLDDYQAQAGPASNLNALINSLLGSRVENRPNPNTGDPEAILFGRPFNAGELSPGQRRMLVWAALLHYQGVETLDGATLLIDEPESNLHPTAAVRVIEQLLELVGVAGQLWLATHSPALITQFALRATIYRVEDAKLEIATDVEDLMDGLLGGPEGTYQMRTVLTDAHVAATVKFCAESLCEPGVADAHGGDKQEAQIKVAVEAAIERSGAVRILDYAAGKARFAQALSELDSKLTSQIEYFAFNSSAHDDFREECERNVAQLAQVAKAALVVDDLSLVRDVDLVILCNALHEFPPDAWPMHLRACEEPMAASGHLLVLEDQMVPIGELPHAAGFVVLELDELKILFGDDDRVIEAARHEVRNLSVFLVPASALKATSIATVIASLTALGPRVLEAIKELRANDNLGRREGRKHAFLALQYLNAKLALQTIGSQVETKDTISSP